MSSFVKVLECGSLAAAATAADPSPAMIGNHMSSSYRAGCKAF